MKRTLDQDQALERADKVSTVNENNNYVLIINAHNNENKKTIWMIKGKNKEKLRQNI